MYNSYHFEIRLRHFRRGR